MALRIGQLVILLSVVVLCVLVFVIVMLSVSGPYAMILQRYCKRVAPTLRTGSSANIRLGRKWLAMTSTFGYVSGFVLAPLHFLRNLQMGPIRLEFLSLSSLPCSATTFSIKTLSIRSIFANLSINYI
jgi:hypothetical protein